MACICFLGMAQISALRPAQQGEVEFGIPFWISSNFLLDISDRRTTAPFQNYRRVRTLLVNCHLYKRTAGSVVR